MASRLADAGLGAWQAFLRTHAAVIRILERELEEQRGLPLAFYDVLVTLQDAPEGRLPMKELADRVAFSRSGLTRLVDRMAHDGLVSRECCPTDRRSTYAVITRSGRDRLAGAAGVHLRGIEAHFARHLSGRELDTVRRAFAKVLAAEGD